MAIRVKEPTGEAPWPHIILAAPPKVGKTYAACAASADKRLGDTYYIPVGERIPHEYKQLGRWKYIDHDRTYEDILDAVKYAANELNKGDKPGMIIIDSMSQVWELISENLGLAAVQRENNRRRKKNLPPVNNPDEAVIDFTLWTQGRKRWLNILHAARVNNGPTIFTARMEEVTVMDSSGRPTTRTQQKIYGHKWFENDVDVIVKMPEPGTAYLSGVRSLVIPVLPGETRRWDGPFSVSALFDKMGVTGEMAPREFSDTQASLHADDVNDEPVESEARPAGGWASQPRLATKKAEPKNDSPKDEPLDKETEIMIEETFRSVGLELSNARLSQILGREIADDYVLTMADGAVLIAGMKKQGWIK